MLQERPATLPGTSMEGAGVSGSGAKATLLGRVVTLSALSSSCPDTSCSSGTTVDDSGTELLLRLPGTSDTTLSPAAPARAAAVAAPSRAASPTSPAATAAASAPGIISPCAANPPAAATLLSSGGPTCLVGNRPRYLNNPNPTAKGAPSIILTPHTSTSNSTVAVLTGHCSSRATGAMAAAARLAAVLRPAEGAHTVEAGAPRLGGSLLLLAPGPLRVVRAAAMSAAAGLLEAEWAVAVCVAEGAVDATMREDVACPKGQRADGLDTLLIGRVRCGRADTRWPAVAAAAAAGVACLAVVLPCSSPGAAAGPMLLNCTLPCGTVLPAVTRGTLRLPVLLVVLVVLIRVAICAAGARASQACRASHAPARGPASATHSSIRSPTRQPTWNSQVACLSRNTDMPTAAAVSAASNGGSTVAAAARTAAIAAASSDTTVLVAADSGTELLNRS